MDRHAPPPTHGAAGGRRGATPLATPLATRPRPRLPRVRAVGEAETAQFVWETVTANCNKKGYIFLKNSSDVLKKLHRR